MTMDKLLGNTMNAQTRTECCCGVFISKDFTCVAPIHTVQHLKSLFNSPLSNFRFSFTHPQQDFFGASPSSFFLYNGQTTSMSVSSLYCTPFLHCTFAIYISQYHCVAFCQTGSPSTFSVCTKVSTICSTV